MVMGMPASGKSTLAAAWAARGYLRLNRDELGGSLLALARRLDRELAHGARRVVVDNTYPTRASRAPVVEVARRHGAAVRCLVMTTSIEQAQANAVARILKPLPGLALALAHARGLDLARSLHLGKGPADRGFATRAGMRYADIADGWPAPGAAW